MRLVLFVTTLLFTNIILVRKIVKAQEFINCDFPCNEFPDPMMKVDGEINSFNCIDIKKSFSQEVCDDFVSLYGDRCCDIRVLQISFLLKQIQELNNTFSSNSSNKDTDSNITGTSQLQPNTTTTSSVQQQQQPLLLNSTELAIFQSTIDSWVDRIFQQNITRQTSREISQKILSDNETVIITQDISVSSSFNISSIMSNMNTNLEDIVLFSKNVELVGVRGIEIPIDEALLDNFSWDIELIYGPNIKFDDVSINEEVILGYNISLRKHRDIVIYEKDCTSSVDSSLIDFQYTLQKASSSHGTLELDLNIKQDSILDSSLWFHSTTDENSKFIVFCVHLELFSDENMTQSVRFDQRTLNVTVDMSSGFTLVGIGAARDDPTVQEVNTTLDYSVIAYQCNQLIPDVPINPSSATLVQGETLTICVKANATSGVYVVTVTQLFIDQPETGITSQAIGGGLNQLSTLDCTSSPGICVLNTFVTSEFFDSDGFINVYGTSILAFGSIPPRANIPRWDVFPVGDVEVVFDDSLNEEIEMFYNISRQTYTVTVYEEDCSTNVSSNYISIVDEFSPLTMTHGILEVKADVVTENVTNSPIYTPPDPTVGSIKFCIRVDLFANTTSVNFHERLVDITVDLTAGFSVNIGNSRQRSLQTTEDNISANPKQYPSEHFFDSSKMSKNYLGTERILQSNTSGDDIVYAGSPFDVQVQLQSEFTILVDDAIFMEDESSSSKTSRLASSAVAVFATISLLLI